MKRHRPLRRGYQSPRKLQAREDLRRFRAALEARVWCEAAGSYAHGRPICGTLDRHEGTDAHHLWPEDRDRGVHDPDRGLWICRTAHQWAHANPAMAAEMRVLRPIDGTDPRG